MYNVFQLALMTVSVWLIIKGITEMAEDYSDGKRPA